MKRALVPPELNDIEIVWGDLKSRHLAPQTFTDLDNLEAAIRHPVAKLNSERYRGAQSTKPETDLCAGGAPQLPSVSFPGVDAV